MKRRWLLWVLLLALLLLVITRFTSLEKLGSTLAAASWRWVLVAAIIHVAYFAAYAWLFKLALASVEVTSRWHEILPTFMASLFVNAIAPSGGAAGGAVWIDEANRRQRSGARTAVGILLQLMIDMAALLPFLAYGLVYLAFRHQLRGFEVAGPVIYTLGILFFLAALLAAWWRPAGLTQLLAGLQQWVNRLSLRLRHKEWIAAGWAERTAGEAKAAVRAVSQHHRLLLMAFTLGLMLHALNAVGLYFLFVALQQQVSAGALIAGFGLGIVFYVVAIVPQGLAATEGVMALVYTSLGVPSAKAIAVILLFRGLNYWLPLLAGAFFARRVRVFGGGQADRAPGGNAESATE